MLADVTPAAVAAAALPFALAWRAGIVADIWGKLESHAGEVLPYAAFYFLLHYFCESAVPPRVWAPLGNKRRAAGQEVSPATLAKEGRMAVVSSLMAVHVTVLALRGFAADAVPFADPYATSPLTTHLVHLAVGYFIWDVAVCLLDDCGPAYLAHGVACLVVFAAALDGFLHYMSLVTLLFEAGTPFLNGRKLLIEAENTASPLFGLCNVLFGVLFFATRIVHGYWQCAHWGLQMNELVAGTLAHPSIAGATVTPHNVPLIRMYQGICVFLCGLNGFWMFIILQGAFQVTGGKGKEKSS